jgi:hypothetical protein
MGPSYHSRTILMWIDRRAGCFCDEEGGVKTFNVFFQKRALTALTTLTTMEHITTLTTLTTLEASITFEPSCKQNIFRFYESRGMVGSHGQNQQCTYLSVQYKEISLILWTIFFYNSWSLRLNCQTIQVNTLC